MSEAKINDKEEALDSVRKNGRALEDIVFEAVKQEDEAIMYASERIQEKISGLEHYGTMAENFLYLDRISRVKSAKMGKVV